MDAVTYDLNRYLAQQDRAESFAEEAERQTQENLAEAITECRASDEKLGEALAEWIDDTSKHTRLGLAIRMALGMSGCAARELYLREIVEEASIAWGHSNHRRVDEDDVAAQIEDARAGL